MSSFPNPGTRQGTASLVLTQLEVARLLAMAALALHSEKCPANADGNCGGCNATRTLFWSLSNALDRPYRVAYQKHLADHGVPLPDAPWEDVDADGAPTES